MSWRRLIDATGPKLKVDAPRLAVVLLGAAVLFALIRAFLPFTIAGPLLLVLAVGGITLDVRLRRSDQRDDDSDGA